MVSCEEILGIKQNDSILSDFNQDVKIKFIIIIRNIYTQLMRV